MPRKNSRKITEPCVGCGAQVPKKQGPTHEYIGASPGCWELFGQLLASIGLALFALSATAPLLQRWLAQTRYLNAGNPYVLYAASNAGSVVALLSYPFVIEPALQLHRQHQGWTAGYALFAVALSACVLLLWKMSSSAAVVRESSVHKSKNVSPPSRIMRLKWCSIMMVYRDK